MEPWLLAWMSGEEKEAAGALWYADALVSFFLVVFAGLMSGLTLGLMSLDVVDLEVLERSGTPREKRQAAAIHPVLQKQHQLLVTLLLCNAGAMEAVLLLANVSWGKFEQRLHHPIHYALPIFLDNMFNPVVAVVLSVTFVLAFGEVIPQAICSRYGLAVGANLIWLVRILMVICCPIAYPVGKLLDHVLGHNDSALFRRAQLKALVSIHGKEAGKGGELTHDETTIISGALDLTEKIAEEAMTPIESTFSLDVNSKLDWEAMGKILARGHSRVPVYEGSKRNIIGLLLVKSLLTVRAEAETPVSAVSIRRIPRVPADMPLYDILNEFQKGSSHMAAVVKSKNKRKPKRSILADALFPHGTEKKDGPHKHRHQHEQDPDLEKGHVKKGLEAHGNGEGRSQDELEAKAEQSENHTDDSGPHHRRSGSQTEGSGLDDVEEGDVIGIITLEDVIEELLQEEIVDETDEYVDVHKRIRVAAVAATMSRVGSMMKSEGGKTTGISTGGSFRDRRDGTRVRSMSTDLPRYEQGAAAAATKPKDDLRQPLLETSVEVEQP